MYIILSDSRKFTGQKVALVDRTKYKDQWWTEEISKAVVFTKKEAADIQCRKIKFNNPQVFTYENGKQRLEKAIVKQSWIEKKLEEKELEWHDDDWYEGIND